ncbi:MAG: cell division protein FtsW, partial [Variovorax sp.]
LVLGMFLWLTRRVMHIGRQAISLDRVFSGLVALAVVLRIDYENRVLMRGGRL